MVRLFSLVALLLIASVVLADDPPPVVKVYSAGKDAVIILPKGLEYMAESSKYLGTKPVIVVEKLPDGGQKLILRDRKFVVDNVGGAKVTIRPGGTVFEPKVFVGIPEGAKYDTPKTEPPKDATPKK